LYKHCLDTASLNFDSLQYLSRHLTLDDLTCAHPHLQHLYL